VFTFVLKNKTSELNTCCYKVNSYSCAHTSSHVPF